VSLRVAVGLSGTRSGWDWVSETLRRSCCYLGVRGARSDVVRCVQCVLLRENAHVASRSRDSVGFRNEGFVSVAAGYGGENGGVGVCSECVGVCIGCKVVRGG
jgi:hypothetical protein